MLIEQIIEFELWGPVPPSRACAPKTGYFHDQIKNLKGKLYTSDHLQLKILQETMYLASPSWAKSLSKFSPKFKI